MAKIQEKLLTLLAQELNDIWKTLRVTVDESNRDLPRELRRCILQYLEEEDVTSREDKGMSLLLQLNDQIGKLKEKNDGRYVFQPQQMVTRHHL